MMRLAFTSKAIPKLPPLAWLFKGTAEGQGRLLHGSSVNVYDSGFMEGCKAASGAEDLREVENVFGSGLSIHGDKWQFVTPSHTLECLYIYRSSRGWSISNSLAFLVAYHGVVPPWDTRYGATFASLSLGIDAYEKMLYRTAEGEMMRVVYDNIECSPNGEFQLVRKPMPPKFSDFDEYVRYLLKILELAFADGMMPGRMAHYRPLATCSTGYDSACIAALAARLGCNEAVTLRNARGGQSDSGKHIGELLGLNIHEFDRLEVVDQAFEEVADFLATGTGGEDYWYRSLGPLLRGRVLLTGFHGDNIWGLHREPSPTLVRGSVSGTSVQEYRLWQDFIHIPVPMIGARRHPEITAIAHAPEMSAYQLHNDYDRPIPRRILEEAGVPRSNFGQHKKASSLLLFHDSRLLRPTVRRECEAAVPRQLVWAAKYHPSGVLWALRYRGYRVLQRANRRLPASKRLQEMLVGDWRIFEHSHPRAALEFLAGLQVVANRYQKALHGYKLVRS